MWESNPPERLLTPYNGFEDREAHQHLSTPRSQAVKNCTSQIIAEMQFGINNNTIKIE